MIALQMKISKNESASYDQSTGYKQYNTKDYDEDEWYDNEEHWNDDDDCTTKSTTGKMKITTMTMKKQNGRTNFKEMINEEIATTTTAVRARSQEASSDMEKDMINLQAEKVEANVLVEVNVRSVAANGILRNSVR